MRKLVNFYSWDTVIELTPSAGAEIEAAERGELTP